jgi:hypothetical protein
MTGGYGTLQAIKVWWASQASLQALVTGGQLWHLEAPETATIEPYLTFFRVSEVPVTWTTGYAYRESTIQFSLHATTAESAESIARTISDAMSTIGGSGAGATFTIHGQDSIHVLPDSFSTALGEGLGTGGRDCWICSFVATVPWTD